MRKTLFFLSIFCLLIVSVSFAKYADLAGSWYAKDGNTLKNELTHYLQQAKIPEIKGKVIGLISPHAGFRYSGSVAAYSYKVLMKRKPELVVLLGFSHRTLIKGKVSALDDDYYSTPIGRVRIDKVLTKQLINAKNNIYDIPEIFSSENAIEMQIPFVQIASKSSKLLLLGICDQSKKNCDELSNVLYNVLKDRRDYIVIASSDMCHYLKYQEANKKDARTIKLIDQLDPEAYYTACMKESRPDGLMCGYGATYTLMNLSLKLGADSVKILKHANSGDTAGGKDKVVGYLSAAFYASKMNDKVIQSNVDKRKKNNKQRGGKDMLSREQKEILLNIARESLMHYLETGNKLDTEVKDPLLQQNMGAFVTLHTNGKLRGCIGHMVATEPLYLTVRDMAIAAGVNDPRFSPVKISDMNDIDIEISVLTPMNRIEDYHGIKIPGQGVMVKRGFRSGVYLPQVADETGWNREEFMNSLCAHKAGIPVNSWKTGDCDIYTFEAIVFGEKDFE